MPGRSRETWDCGYKAFLTFHKFIIIQAFSNFLGVVRKTKMVVNLYHTFGPVIGFHLHLCLYCEVQHFEQLFRTGHVSFIAFFLISFFQIISIYMPKLSHHTSIVFGQSLLMAQTVRIMYLVLSTFMFESEKLKFLLLIRRKGQIGP